MNNLAGTKRIAVVTGANKGIGFEISKQLASNGIQVVLTARDGKRGSEAVDELKAAGYSDVFFHQLDVTDPASVSSLAIFIGTQFGKLDILVNNAGVSGSELDSNHQKDLILDIDKVIGESAMSFKKILRQNYELSTSCVETNYYGTKSVCKALIPLLQLSDSPRIVNVSSMLGQLQFITNENARKELEDVDELSEEKMDKVVEGFLEDDKENRIEVKGWLTNYYAYSVSKAAVNAYTRMLAKKYPNIAINAVHPGYVKTDINHNSGVMTTEEGAEGPVMLALMPKGGPSGLFFDRTEVSTF